MSNAELIKEANANANHRYTGDPTGDLLVRLAEALEVAECAAWDAGYAEALKDDGWHFEKAENIAYLSPKNPHRASASNGAGE